MPLIHASEREGSKSSPYLVSGSLIVSVYYPKKTRDTVVPRGEVEVHGSLNPDRRRRSDRPAHAAPSVFCMNSFPQVVSHVHLIMAHSVLRKQGHQSDKHSALRKSGHMPPSLVASLSLSCLSYLLGLNLSLSSSALKRDVK